MSLIFLFGFASYLVAEILSFSGIISMFACGIIFNYYLYKNLSDVSKKTSTVAFNSIGYLAEAFVWSYLGKS